MRVRERTEDWRRAAEAAAVLALLALAALLYVARLGQQGYGNQYYAAAARSMSTGWTQFFFASFDPAGFISVDKPPVALWFQAASVRALGFSGWSVLLPNALAGVVSIAVLYAMVRARFGVLAALCSGLALALTPITVATMRNNNPDAILIMFLLLAACAAQRAARSGSLRWLILSALLAGIAFNTKTLQAVLVLPALGLSYLVSAPPPLRRRLAHLLAAGVVVAVVSASWILAVDSIPAGSRPYVGGSTDNSELSLAFGHNGVDRLDTPGAPAGSPDTTTNLGRAGWQRFFSGALAPQISWFLPLAAFGALAGWLGAREAARTNPQRAAILLWVAWALTHLVVFSVVAGHRYYTAALAPAIAALAGIGLARMIAAATSSGRSRRTSACVVACAAAFQLYILTVGPRWNTWLIPVVPAMAGAAVVALLLPRINSSARSHYASTGAAGVLAVLSILLAPAVWSASPLIHAASASGGDPHAGPAFAAAPSTSAPDLVPFLEARRGRAKYLLATLGSMRAAPLIIRTGEPVMAIGGWNGADPAPTASQLASLISSGAVRFVLLDGALTSRPGHYVPPSTLKHDDRFVIPRFVRAHCTQVDPARIAGEQSLYDCTPPPRPQARTP